MIVGFNHNVQYRGVGFHVQTEDSGPKKPQLVTLLYHNGTIISSQKTMYSDILKVDNLDQVIEDLAKEQHKGMLRRLTKGEFDQRIVELGIPLGSPAGGGKQPQATEAPPAQQAEPAAAEESERTSPITTATDPGSAVKTVKPAVAKQEPPPKPAKIVEEPVVDKFRKPKPAMEQTLDDLIYAYLTGSKA